MLTSFNKDHRHMWSRNSSLTERTDGHTHRISLSRRIALRGNGRAAHTHRLLKDRRR